VNYIKYFKINNMSLFFDGKDFANSKEEFLKKKVSSLRKRGVIPKLFSIIVGEDPASVLYVNLKKKRGEKIGVKVEVKSFSEGSSVSDIVHEIKKANKDKSVHGIMVQLPLPPNFSDKDRNKIINSIARKKDVDGLRDDSPYLTPTVKAVLEVIKKATPYIEQLNSKETSLGYKVAVVGYKGFEGSKIFKVLKEMGYDVSGVDRKDKDLKAKTLKADILISVTGSFGIIGKEEVKEGAIVIDVGSPKGDVRIDEIIDKASFISPVPGGVGPVTISCLLENLVFSAGG